MENSYFIYCTQNVIIEKLHICTWEFKDNSAILEIGFEISNQIYNNNVNEIEFQIYIPWIDGKTEIVDLYENLKDSRNSKFIFNDNVNNTNNLDGGDNLTGIIHNFTGRKSLCILPICSDIDNQENLLNIKVIFPEIRNNGLQPNPYFRFYIKTDINSITTRKTGIGKSTIIYDIKINEKRNIPDKLLKMINSSIDHTICEVKTCFCIHILPNNYNPTVLEINSLKSIRSLEIESFKRYLPDKKIKENELIVIFMKKKNLEPHASYSFFSIFDIERIGAAQFALAILINLICGLLIVLPSLRRDIKYSELYDLFYKLPSEIYIAFSIIIAFLIYFIWPWFNRLIIRFKGLFRN